jgi:hypothetical protein
MTTRQQWVTVAILMAWGVFFLCQGIKAHNYMKRAGLIDQADDDCAYMVLGIENLHAQYTRKTFEMFDNSEVQDDEGQG